MALIQAINNDHALALQTLGKYRRLVSSEEAAVAEEVLNDLKKSTNAAKGVSSA